MNLIFSLNFLFTKNKAVKMIYLHTRLLISYVCARLPFLRVCQKKKTLLWSLWCVCASFSPQWLSLWFFRCFPPDLTQILHLYGNRILYLSLHTEIECQRMFNLYSFVVALFIIVSSFNMEHFHSCLFSSIHPLVIHMPRLKSLLRF